MQRHQEQQSRKCAMKKKTAIKTGLSYPSAVPSNGTGVGPFQMPQATVNISSVPCNDFSSWFLRFKTQSVCDVESFSEQ